MLASMRNYSKSLVVKAFFFFLAVVFAVWGIGDIFRGSGKQVVAKIGSAEISYYEYRSALERRLEQLRQSYGNNVTMLSLKQAGEDRALLEQMVNDELIKQRVNNLKISVGDDLIKAEILNTKFFYDEKGNFSKEIFNRLLASKGLNQDRYIEMLRDNIATSLFMNSFNVTLPIGETYTKPLMLHRYEQRQADIIVIPHNYIQSNINPTDTELVQFYNNNNTKFSVPELRKISYIKFDLNFIKKNVVITQTDIEKEYNSHKNEFTEEESRIVDQYLFNDENAAKEAYKNILAKKSVSGKIELGNVKKSGLPKELRQQVFDLAKNTVSTPIKSTLGWHIFIVKEIIPAREKSLVEVREQIRNELLHNKTYDALYKFNNDIETQISEGKTLDEIAKNFNLIISTTEPITKEGLAANGSKVALPDPSTLLPLIFKQNVDVESSVINIADNNFVIFKVTQVTLPRIKPLDEVKGLAVQLFKQERMETKLKEFADQWSKKVAKDPKEFANLKSLNGVKIHKDKILKRFSNDNLSNSPKITYPDGLINDIFSKNKK